MKSIIFAFCFMLAAATIQAAKLSEPAQRIEKAEQVFNEIMEEPDKGIPLDLLKRAHCIVIIPGLKKGAFIVGGKFGKGVVLCREQDNSGWTGPSTVRMEGGSFGLQIGGGEVDIVMVVMNDEGAEKLMETEFTLGGEASVMAGPVGRSAQAQTDAVMHAEILAWSRARGVFAGLALEGATLRAAREDNRTLYGEPVTHKEILRGRVASPDSAEGLIATLSSYSQSEK